MPENDLNKGQLVTDPDLNNADLVGQQGLTDQSATDQNQELLADGTDPNKTVKYSELKKATDAKNAEATARKEAEEKAAYAQRQLELVMAQQQGQQMAQPQAAPKTSLEQAMLEYGVTSDELYGDVIIKVMARKDEIDNAIRQQQNAVFANQQFVSTHPDVAQVVGSVNPMSGQVMTMSPEFAAVIAKKPYLAGACSTVESMYQIVMQERKLAEFEKNQVSLQEHQNRQGVDTATQPMGGSAAGGGGAGDQHNQPLMNREQVAEWDRKLDSGEQI